MDRGSIACVFSMIEEATLSYFHEVVASFEALLPKYKVTGGSILLMKKRYLEVMLVTVCLCMATGSALGLEKIPDWLTGTPVSYTHLARCGRSRNFTAWHPCYCEKKPDWLTGKLCMLMYGTEGSEAEYPLDRFLDKYLCVFDLDANVVDSIRVPDDASLVRECVYGDPVLFYTAEPGYHWYDAGPAYHANRWRVYEMAEVLSPKGWQEGDYMLGKIYPSTFMGTHIEDTRDEDNHPIVSSSWPPIYNMLAPLNVAAIHNDDGEDMWTAYDLFYMAYGLSEERTPEIQMLHEKSTGAKSEFIKLYSFPIDYDFGAWACVFSKDGRVAFRKDDKLICVADDTVYEHQYNYPTDPPLYTCMTWRDNELLIFDKYDRKTQLCTLQCWNPEKDTFEPVQDSTGELIQLEPTPLAMALSADGSVLAVYTFGGLLQYINLETGDLYVEDLWAHETCLPTEQGVHIYPPPNKLMDYQTQVVWFPE